MLYLVTSPHGSPLMSPFFLGPHSRTMEQSGARDGADPAQRAKVEDLVCTAIVDVPVTVQRRPFLQPEDDQRLIHTGKTAHSCS